MDLHLRPARPGDAERINGLFTEMLRTIYHTDRAESYPEGYLDRFFSGGEDWILLAEEGETTVAFLSMEVHREQTDFLYLDDFSVTEAFRNRGIGTAMLRRAEAYAEKLGIGELRLHVEKSNQAALRLYERLGYSLLEDQQDRLLMSRKF